MAASWAPTLCLGGRIEAGGPKSPPAPLFQRGEVDAIRPVRPVENATVSPFEKTTMTVPPFEKGGLGGIYALDSRKPPCP